MLPVQCWPSPVYPLLQVQVNEPSVLIHDAVMSQVWTLLAHSSISEITRRIHLGKIILNFSFAEEYVEKNCTLDI